MATDRKKRKIHIKRFKTEKSQNRKKTEAKQNAQAEQNSEQNNSKLKLINGKRKKRKIIRIVSYVLAAAVVITLFIVNALTPTGLVESLQNSYAAMGKGEYPVNVYSANSTYFNCWNDIVCIVNDSFFELYNDQGKLLQAVSHGFADPVVEMSQARYLLYDRGRYSVNVYNYSDEIYSREFDKTIVSADIGRDGTFAVVTDSDTYQNTVFVYNKDNESVYTWNSANYYITDVAVSDDGEKLAVCMLNSVNGYFESYIYILEFDSADPVSRYSFNGVVSSLTSCGENYILANGFDRAYSVPWNGGNETDIGISGSIRCYDYSVDGRSCVVWGREDNEQVNFASFLNSAGKITSTVTVNTAVTDLCVSETKVALLLSNDVYVYDNGGNLKQSYQNDVKGLYLGITEDGKILVLDNSKLIKIN